MKRDLDLVRDILVFFEERDGRQSIVKHEELAATVGKEVALVAYHVRIMAQEGLLACELVRSTTSDRIINAFPFELTWDGQEFLKISREKAWNDVKRRLGDGFANVSFEILKALLLDYAKKSVGLSE